MYSRGAGVNSEPKNRSKAGAGWKGLIERIRRKIVFEKLFLKILEVLDVFEVFEIVSKLLGNQNEKKVPKDV